MDIFCQIIHRQAPANIVMENDSMLAILDIEPETEGHTLIMPKRHCTQIEELTGNELIHFITILKDMMAKLRSQYGYRGIKLLCNSGEDIQDIRHLHFHVIGKNI